MTLTLDEWADKYASKLRDNLAINIRVYCEDMNEEDKDSFLRVNLIMIRQWKEHSDV